MPDLSSISVAWDANTATALLVVAALAFLIFLHRSLRTA